MADTFADFYEWLGEGPSGTSISEGTELQAVLPPGQSQCASCAMVMDSDEAMINLSTGLVICDNCITEEHIYCEHLDEAKQQCSHVGLPDEGFYFNEDDRWLCEEHTATYSCVKCHTKHFTKTKLMLEGCSDCMDTFTCAGCSNTKASIESHPLQTGATAFCELCTECSTRYAYCSTCETTRNFEQVVNLGELGSVCISCGYRCPICSSLSKESQRVPHLCVKCDEQLAQPDLQGV